MHDSIAVIRLVHAAYSWYGAVYNPASLQPCQLWPQQRMCILGVSAGYQNQVSEEASVALKREIVSRHFDASHRYNG